MVSRSDVTEGGGALHFSIQEDDLNGPEIAQLLQFHLDEAAANTPLDLIHALDIERLRAPDITFWTAWSDGVLVGCGALRALDAAHGEIKSMHTARLHRGKGVAARLLEHIISEARARSYTRISLETGASEAYVPARALYESFGFAICPPFADYPETPNSVCMTRRLLTGSDF
ncbi:MAG: putative acetyltransferase [Rhodothermales bacterium]|jgi:putative acetyltransferase